MKMKKERYEEPNIFVYLFENEDVCTVGASDIGTDESSPFTLQKIN